MADRDPVQPLHQPVLPVFDEEEVWVQHAAERFEDAAAEDLRPHEDTHGAWHCRSCARVFSLKLVGLVSPT